MQGMKDDAPMDLAGIRVGPNKWKTIIQNVAQRATPVDFGDQNIKIYHGRRSLAATISTAPMTPSKQLSFKCY